MVMQGMWRISKFPEGIFSSESLSMLVEWEGKVSQSWQRLDLLYLRAKPHPHSLCQLQCGLQGLEQWIQQRQERQKWQQGR